MINEIKVLRINLDVQLLLLRSLQSSAEIQKCINSIMLGRAWTGKVLGKLGDDYPYKNDGNRTEVNDIEAATDKVKGFKETIEDYTGSGFVGECPILKQGWKETTHIARVDHIRETLGVQIKHLPNYEKFHQNTFQSIFEKYKGEVGKEELEKEEYNNIPDWELEILKCYEHLTEARFWLGYELERIKNTI